MSKFAIIAAPRTGSNLLCTLLNSHPEILCHHEVFNPHGIFTALTHRHEHLALGSLEERDRDPLAFLQRVWETAQGSPATDSPTAGVKSVGFKWTRGQNPIVLRSVLEDTSVKKIILKRRNRIKTFISEKIAQRTEQWEVYSEPELIWPRPRVTVDCDELLRHISLNDHFYHTIEQTLSDSDQSAMNVFYETLFNAEEQGRLLKFLGVEDVTYRLTAASVKQNSTDLKDSIANFGELAANLETSDLGAELHERDL